MNRLLSKRSTLFRALMGNLTNIQVLNEREAQCLRLVNKGMSSKEIGRALDLSPHTVDQYITRAMRALNAPNRLAAGQILAELDNAAPSDHSGSRLPIKLLTLIAIYFATLITGFDLLTEQMERMWRIVTAII